MSFDIIVIKPTNLDAESQSDVREVSPLGDAESVRRIYRHETMASKGTR